MTALSLLGIIRRMGEDFSPGVARVAVESLANNGEVELVTEHGQEAVIKKE